MKSYSARRALGLALFFIMVTGTLAPAASASAIRSAPGLVEFAEALTDAGFNEAETAEEMLAAVDAARVAMGTLPESAETLARLLDLYARARSVSTVLEAGEFEGALAGLADLRARTASEPGLGGRDVADRLDLAIDTLAEAPALIEDARARISLTGLAPDATSSAPVTRDIQVNAPASSTARAGSDSPRTDSLGLSGSTRTIIKALGAQLNDSSAAQLFSLESTDARLRDARDRLDAASDAAQALRDAGLTHLVPLAAAAVDDRAAVVSALSLELARAVNVLDDAFRSLRAGLDQEVDARNATFATLEVDVASAESRQVALLAAETAARVAELDDLAALVREEVDARALALDALALELSAARRDLERAIDAGRVASEASDHILNGRIDELAASIAGKAWTAILDRDGTGSRLDADTLDGLDSDDFVRKAENGTITDNLTVEGVVEATRFIGNGSMLTGIVVRNADTLDFLDSTDFARADALVNETATREAEDARLTDVDQGLLAANQVIVDDLEDLESTLAQLGQALPYIAWDAVLRNDGAGSRLDADKLDGLSSESFLRSDAATTTVSGALFANNGKSGFTGGALVLAGGGGGVGNNGGAGRALVDAGASGLIVNIANDFGRTWVQGPLIAGDVLEVRESLEVAGPLRPLGPVELQDAAGTTHVLEQRGDATGVTLRALENPAPTHALFTVRSSQDSERFAVEHDGVVRTSNSDIYVNAERDATGALVGADTGPARKVWHEGNDGSGSGLVADTLDGIDSGSFLRRDWANAGVAGNFFASGGRSGFVGDGTILKLGGARSSNAFALADRGADGLVLNQYNDFGKVRIEGPTIFTQDVSAWGKMSVGSQGLQFYDGTVQTSGVMVGEISGGGAKVFNDPRYEVTRFVLSADQFISLLIAVYGGHVEALANDGVPQAEALMSFLPAPVKDMFSVLLEMIITIVDMVGAAFDYVITAILDGVNSVIYAVNDVIKDCPFCPTGWSVSPVRYPGLALTAVIITDFVAGLAYDMIKGALDAVWGDPKLSEDAVPYIPGLYRVRFTDDAVATWSMVEATVPAVDATSLSNSLMKSLSITDENDETVESDDLVVLTTRSALGVPMPFPSGFRFLRTAMSYPFKAEFQDLSVRADSVTVTFPDPTSIIARSEMRLNSGDWQVMTGRGDGKWHIDSEILDGDTLRFRAIRNVAGTQPIESGSFAVDLPFDPVIDANHVVGTAVGTSRTTATIAAGQAVSAVALEVYGNGWHALSKIAPSGRSTTTWQLTYGIANGHMVRFRTTSATGETVIGDWMVVDRSDGALKERTPLRPNDVVVTHIRPTTGNSLTTLDLPIEAGVERVTTTGAYNFDWTRGNGDTWSVTSSNGYFEEGAIFVIHAKTYEGATIDVGSFVVSLRSQRDVLPRLIEPTYDVKGHGPANHWWADINNALSVDMRDPITGLAPQRIEYTDGNPWSDMERVGDEYWHDYFAVGHTVTLRAWFGTQYVESTWDLGLGYTVTRTS